MENSIPSTLKLFKPYVKCAFIGVLYLMWVKITGISIECPFRAITGYYCPGCGVTTLFLCLSVFDFCGAFHANPFLFVLLPVIFWLIVQDKIYRTNNRQHNKTYNKISITTIIILVAYGIIRNI
ncbi:MAG: DUF2752 domain-containing protein [Selenomonadaceae bacterium]|nr:DUF2752 domain-containing protein [Selenomonadaceae bacterium]